MFCPSCGKQNPDNVIFCTSCGKALPQKSSVSPVIQPSTQTNLSPERVEPKKAKLSFNVVKAVITGVLIVALIVVILQIYYPGIFPWN
jgi:uncharacterized membrane protein YvbJ